MRLPSLPRSGLAITALTAALLSGTAAMGQSVNLAPSAPMPIPMQQNSASPQAMAPQPAVAIDDSVAFNHTERWMIPRYFSYIRANQAHAARAKKFQRILPKGIGKAPEKGDILSPAVVASLHRLPGPLLRDLPAARPDTERLVVGTDIVMLRPSSGEVLDVLQKVIE